MTAPAAVSALPTAPNFTDMDQPLSRFPLPRSEVIIRPLQESDNARLEWHGGADLRGFYNGQWVAHSIGEAFVLIADFNGFPIGQAALYWQGKPAHPQVPDLQSLRVHPIFQGQGIGTKILQAAEIAVQQHGHTCLGLSVGIHNDGAQRLYERCGFRIIGEPYEDIWRYTDAKGETIVVAEIVLDLLKCF
jgi:ribosomal protein S18 acetylase RimI-like enzyme